jgi:cytochrome c-type biogenesis protein CcmE
MKPKQQRLILALLGVAAVGGAAVLALSGMTEQAAFYYAPSDLVGKPVPTDRAVRLGGMVEKGSIKRKPDGVSIDFAVIDPTTPGARVPVFFRGVPPDLFKEDSGVVAEGRFNPDGSFTAENLLAKHDERYMPPQAAGNMHKSESLDP